MEPKPIRTVLHEIRQTLNDQRGQLDQLDAEIAGLKAAIREIQRNGAGAGITGG